MITCLPYGPVILLLFVTMFLKQLFFPTSVHGINVEVKLDKTLCKFHKGRMTETPVEVEPTILSVLFSYLFVFFFFRP